MLGLVSFITKPTLQASEVKSAFDIITKYELNTSVTEVHVS
jgi:hypothetical protein